MHTINAFASRSRSLAVFALVCPTEWISQEFCVFTSKSNMDRMYGTRNLNPAVYISMPEQGYYNVSNAQSGRCCFFCSCRHTQKNTHTHQRTFHMRGKMNKKGSEFRYTQHTSHISHVCILHKHIQTHTHPIELINFLDLCAFWDFNLYFIYGPDKISFVTFFVFVWKRMECFLFLCRQILWWKKHQIRYAFNTVRRFLFRLA